MRKLMGERSLAGLFGIAFLLVGAAGFVPGLVDHYERLAWWKDGSGAELFGLFRTSILHNFVHLGFGAVGLLAARAATAARVYLSGGGAAYVALGAYGLVIDLAGSWNVVPVDRADDWLHLGLGIAMLYGGLVAALPALRPQASP